MKLTRNDIAILSRILSGVKINCVSDADAKKKLMTCYLEIRKAQKESDGEQNEILQKFQDDWKDEIIAVAKLREAKAEVAGHDKYLAAENDFNQMIGDVLSKEVEVTIEKFPASVLYDSELWGKDDTMGQIANSVEFLMEKGIAE